MQCGNELITVREAAERARVSTATIRRLVAAGKLRTLRIGRSIRIDGAAFSLASTKGGRRGRTP